MPDDMPSLVAAAAVLAFLGLCVLGVLLGLAYARLRQLTARVEDLEAAVLRLQASGEAAP